MSSRLASDPQFVDRFLQEARAQAGLQHSRILGVTDFFSEDSVFYLVMPLLTGRSLEDRIRLSDQPPLSQTEALAIANDILDALDYANQRGIIHRDVKPSNVLLDGHGHAYLTDFGIALLVGQQQRLTRTGTSLGTAEYISPEQIRTPRAIDHRTDVYSAGCVLYQMLAGRPPFVPRTRKGRPTLSSRRPTSIASPSRSRTWNPNIAAKLDAVVLRALAKSPDHRLAAA